MYNGAYGNILWAVKGCHLQHMTIYTPTSHFFQHPVQQMPSMNPDYWALMVSGSVRVPLLLSYADLHAMQATETPCTIACAGEKTWIGTALWKGVRLQDLITLIELRHDAQFACFYAADGYVTSLPLNQLQDTLLAYSMNDRPLSIEHGAPLRLIAPGRYGYKMPRWLQRIEFTARPALSIWEQRGWSTGGKVTPRAVITIPDNQAALHGPVQVSGFAFAGASTIHKVAISVDEGPWTPVEFNPAQPYTWTSWTAHWTPHTPGSYRLAAQAFTENTDNSQVEAPHSIILHVTP